MLSRFLYCSKILQLPQAILLSLVLKQSIREVWIFSETWFIEHLHLPLCSLHNSTETAVKTRSEGQRIGEATTTTKFVEARKQMDGLFDLAEHRSTLRGTSDQTELCWDTPEKLRIPLKVGIAGRDEKGEQGESSAPRFPPWLQAATGQRLGSLLWKLETLDSSTTRGRPSSLKRWGLWMSWYSER